MRKREGILGNESRSGNELCLPVIIIVKGIGRHQCVFADLIVCLLSKAD